jgi:hypothetical protein
MSVKKLILIVALVLGGMAGTLLLLLAWILQPDAPVQDLVDRKPQRVAVTRTDAEPVDTSTYTVSGRVEHDDGSPAADVEIEVREDLSNEQHGTLSDPEGRWSLEVTGPGQIRPEDLPSTPWYFPVEGPRDDLVFVVPELCPLAVTVVDRAGQAVFPGRAAARVASGAWNRRWTTYKDLDEQGQVLLDHVACGVADVQAKADGFVKGRTRDIDSMTTSDVTVVLSRGISLDGTVTDSAGEPVADATVSAGLATTGSDADGRYDLHFDPSDTTNVSVRAAGFIDQEERLRVASDSSDLTIDWVLESSRELEVYCAGLKDDSCADVMPMMCTRPWLPFGEPCDRDDPTMCTCPSGVSAIRGGGQSVEVQPGQRVAWLDFRAGGGLVGRVVQDGVPQGCGTMTIRLPEDLSDVTRGGVAGRSGACDEDGMFQVDGLDPGMYQVEVTSGGNNRRPNPVRVQDTVVDMGLIDLDAGTDIEGVVVDGVTGQGAPGEMVVGVQIVADKAMPGTSVAVSRSEGRFVLRGVSDGDWSVFLASRPFSPVDVTVADGTVSREPELETGAADLLDEQGFGLATDDMGDLVVSELDPDGAAADAGLESGDTLVGVTVMGVDVGEYLPGLEGQVLDAVLEHYSGPGVGLVVDRDGERVEVPLD